MQLRERTTAWEGPRIQLDWICRKLRLPIAKAVDGDRPSLVVDNNGMPKAWVVPAHAVTEEVAGEVREVLDDVIESVALSHTEAWERVIEGRKRIELTEDSYDRLLDLVRNPRQPDARLRALVSRRDRG